MCTLKENDFFRFNLDRVVLATSLVFLAKCIHLCVAITTILDSNLHAVFTFNECYDIRSVYERIVMYFGGKIDKNEKNGIKDMN